MIGYLIVTLLIGSGESSTAIDPNNAHCWWDVTEHSSINSC